jgi:hypothetical protein
VRGHQTLEESGREAGQQAAGRDDVLELTKDQSKGRLAREAGCSARERTDGQAHPSAGDPSLAPAHEMGPALVRYEPLLTPRPGRSISRPDQLLPYRPAVLPLLLSFFSGSKQAATGGAN